MQINHPYPLPKLQVMADPVWAGKHPYHDCRYICTERASFIEGNPFRADNPDEPCFELINGSCVAKMTDCELQRDYANLFAAAPDLYAAALLALDRFAALEDADELTQRDADAVEALRVALLKAQGVFEGAERKPDQRAGL